MSTPTAPLTDSTSRAARLHLVGGRLCLNFANTTSGRCTDQHLDHLTSYRTLLAWAGHASIVGKEDAVALVELAEKKPAEARHVHDEALALRDTIHGVFQAIAHGETADPALIGQLNQWLVRVMTHARLVPEEDGFDWGWAEPCRHLDSLLWPIVRSAAETLTVAPHSRIRECPGPDCGWLFLDTSKSGRRRWCDMSVCGNRSKAREHYRRIKGEVKRPRITDKITLTG